LLFGAVSISDGYSAHSRELIVRFLARNSRRDLEAFARPRQPFRPRLRGRDVLALAAETIADLEELNDPIRDIDARAGVPVLLRQYLKLGGEVVGFNVDSSFSNVVDCLLTVDLRRCQRKALKRYMGAAGLREFLSYHGLAGE
jgi:putative hemolysin